MTQDEHERDAGRDAGLSRLLKKWEAPVVPDGLDERVMAAYRRQSGGGGPLWRRLLTSSVRVPVPVALAVALLLMFTAVLALRPTSPPPAASAPTPTGPVRSAQRSAPVVTGTSLAGFQPVTEVTATVVPEGSP